MRFRMVTVLDVGMDEVVAFMSEDDLQAAVASGGFDSSLDAVSTSKN